MLKNALWIIDATTVAVALTQALTKQLHCPVQSVSPADLPAASEAPALALVEILLPDACGLTLATHLRAQTGATVAVWSTRPAPVYAWVAWQVGLNGCLDKALAWEHTLPFGPLSETMMEV